MSKRILLVRPDGIGDFIIFSTVLDKYAQLYPDYEIDLLCHPQVKELAVAVPFLHRIFCINQLKISNIKYKPYLWYLLMMLNLKRYQKIIDSVYSPYKEMDEVIKLIQCGEKIAWDGDKSNNPANERFSRNNIFTLLLESDQEKKLEIDRNAEFIRKLGLNLKEELKPKLWFLPQDDTNAQKLMRQEELLKKKYICLFPGAGFGIKYWSSQNWIGLINALLDSYPNYKIVLLGSGNDFKLIDQILSGLERQDGVSNLYGKTKVRTLAKIIEYSSMLIGMDTGAIHIAAALNVPNICIMGGGHFGRFYPYGDLNRNRIVYHKMDCYDCNWHCIYEVAKCIKNIKVDEVLNEAETLIKASLAD